MLRARVAVGVCTAALAAVVLAADGGSSPAQPREESCAELDTTYTTESLHDVRSFADAMAIVRGVKEAVPPTPDGPEGWAGLIGRYVTVRVERVLWRRPHAPEPPRRFRFGDFGWTGTLKDRKPWLGCRATRMELGRRYLAPVVRDHGEWYPFPATRLRMRGDLVVGGVDLGEPEHSHQALAGQTVPNAARTVAETLPYRTTVLHPGGGPRRRWERAYRDHYRLWGDPKGVPVIVASGVTSRSRWQLYLRLPARGGMCVGMSVRRLWRGRLGPSGEGCGDRTVPPFTNRIGLFSARGRGVFAYGHTGSKIYSVRALFDGEEAKEVQTTFTPDPPGGRDRFWVVPAERDCENVTVQAIGPNGDVVDEQRLEGYAACSSG
jgi:hypothetical protein